MSTFRYCWGVYSDDRRMRNSRAVGSHETKTPTLPTGGYFGPVRSKADTLKLQEWAKTHGQKPAYKQKYPFGSNAKKTVEKSFPSFKKRRKRSRLRKIKKTTTGL